MWRFSDMGEDSVGNRSGNTGKSRRHVRKWWMKAMIPVLLLLVMGTGIKICRGYQDHWMAIQARLDILPDIHAKRGTLHEREMQEVADGSFWVLVNQIPTMREGDTECNIEYENPASNHYSARISLYRKETGELLGNTRRVDPGRYVEYLQMKQELPAGEYPVRASIELFHNKTPAGNLSLDITLQVLDPEKKEEAE